jgi:hypothetical protein
MVWAVLLFRLVSVHFFILYLPSLVAFPFGKLQPMHLLMVAVPLLVAIGLWMAAPALARSVFGPNPSPDAPPPRVSLEVLVLAACFYFGIHYLVGGISSLGFLINSSS